MLTTGTLRKLKGRQGLLYFQVRLCVCWKGENTKAVLNSFEQNHMIVAFLVKLRFKIDYNLLLVS